MNVQCKNCSPEEGVEIPDFTESEKIDLQELNLTSPLHTVKLLMSKFQVRHIDAKYIVTHMNTDYGYCKRCSFDNLDGEYIKCPKCDALNFNWKINTPITE
jgi:hypothetical protein